MWEVDGSWWMGSCEWSSADASRFVYELMQAGDFMAFPMAWAATEQTAAKIDVDWPAVVLLKSAEDLHTLLLRGPYAWWERSAEA